MNESKAADLAALPGMIADAVSGAVAGIRAEMRSSEQSEDLGELVKALCAARPKFGEIKKAHQGEVKGVAKGSGRDYSYTYRYASLDEVIEATAVPLAEHGIYVFSGFEDQTRNSVTVVTELHHESGQWRRNRITITCGEDPQSIGSAGSYGRRYGYLAILNLAPVDDDDGAGAKRGALGNGGGALPSERARDSVAELIEDGDLKGALNALRAVMNQHRGAGGLNPMKVRQLFGLPGWSESAIRAFLAENFNGLEPPDFPWKAFEALLAYMDAVGPPEEPRTRGKAPTWSGVWTAIKEEIGKIPSNAKPMGEAYAEEFLLPEIVQSSGWSIEQISRVLMEELAVVPSELPRLDSNHKPLNRWLVRAFSAFPPPKDDGPSGDDAPLPNDPAEDDDAAGGEEDPSSAQEAVVLSLEACLAPVSGELEAGFPCETEDATWAAIGDALSLLRKSHPEVAGAISPDNKMKIYRRQDNGGRTSDEAAAMVRDRLGISAFEVLPDILAAAVLEALGAFPAPGAEAAAARLGMPTGWRSMRPAELQKLVRIFEQQGKLGPEDLPQGRMGKQDYINAIESVLKRHGIDQEKE